MEIGEARYLMARIKSYLVPETPSNHGRQNMAVLSKHYSSTRFDQNCWLLLELKARYADHLDVLFGS